MTAKSKQPLTCFIDTNIWLYAFVETSQKDNKRKRRIASQTIKANEVIISTQVINETCVNLLKKTEIPESKIQSLIASFYKKLCRPRNR